MPRIPSAEQLGTVIPRTARGSLQHAPIDRSADIIASGAQNLARGVQDVADLGFQLQQKEDKFSYARAKSVLMQSDAELRQSLENDPDFNTFEKRYTEGMAKARETATSMIRSNNDKRVFELDADMDVSRGAAAIRDFAKTKEVDWGKSTLDETLEGIRANAIASKDDAVRLGAIDNAKDLIIGAQERGYLTKEQATNVFQAWRDSSVQGYIESQDAAKQIEILSDNKSVASLLQPDVKAKMLKVAQTQGDIVVAQEYADKVVSEGLPLNDALTKARADLEGPVRNQALSEIKQQYADREASKQLVVKEISTKGWSTVMETDAMPTGKQLARIREVAPEEERQMRDWLLKKKTADGSTDMDKWMYLNDLSANDPVAFSGINLRQWEPYLSVQDQKTFSNKQAAISKGDIKAMQSTQVYNATVKLIKNEILSAGIDPSPKEGSKEAKDLAMFSHSLQQALDAETEKKGKALSADEARTIGMSLLRDKIEGGDGFLGMGFGRDKKRGYQLTEEEKKTYVAMPFNDIPIEIRSALQREYEALYPKSVESTGYMSPEKRAAIERAYTRGVDRGQFK